MKMTMIENDMLKDHIKEQLMISTCETKKMNKSVSVNIIFTEVPPVKRKRKTFREACNRTLKRATKPKINK